MKKRIYLDYAAATPLRDEAADAMAPWTQENFANPSGIYKEAEKTRKALEEARESIAKIIRVRADEVVFTSSSTESNNMAIFGVAKREKEKGHIITIKTEHPSILEPLRALEKDDWRVSFLPVARDGIVEPEEIKKAVTKDTKLITLSWANSETGAIQPIKEIGQIAKDTGVVFHIDVSQAEGHLNLLSAKADLITLSSTKIYGPRGIAALVIGSNVKIKPLIYGGGQERHMRSGTENVAGAVGFAAALVLAQKERKKEVERLRPLRDKLIDGVLAIEGTMLVGPASDKRLAKHTRFAFSAGDGKVMDGEELAIRLDERGFAVSNGPTCSTGEEGVSDAIKALGIPEDYSRATLRVSFGRETTDGDIEKFIKALGDVIGEIRSF